MGTLRRLLFVFMVCLLLSSLAGPLAWTIAGDGVSVTVNAPEEVDPDTDFTVTIDISEVQELNAVQYDISFDTSVLRLDDVTAGTIDSTSVPVSGRSEISEGTYRIVQSMGLTSVSGSGSLAVLHFHAVGTAGSTSDISITNGILSNMEAQEIPATWSGDTVRIAGAIPQYTLSVSVDPAGSGTVTLNPPGGTYDSGTQVTLTATANPGYVFDEWSGDLSGTDNPATITMDSDKSVTAHFSQIPTIVINEFMSNPAEGDTEWVELFNKTGQSVDLTDWTLADGAGNSLGSLGSITAGGYLLIEISGNKLNNSGDLIVLKWDTTEVDRVAYGNWDDGNTADNAPAPGTGQSTGRYPNGQDTDVDNIDFRVFAQDTRGAENALAPQVATNDASNITQNSATLNGELTSLGTATSVQVSFEWGTTSGALDHETTPEQLNEAGAFSANLTGLTPSTTYYFQAKAVGDGTAYGNEMSFTTAPQAGAWAEPSVLALAGLGPRVKQVLPDTVQVTVAGETVEVDVAELKDLMGQYEERLPEGYGPIVTTFHVTTTGSVDSVTLNLEQFLRNLFPNDKMEEILGDTYTEWDNYLATFSSKEMEGSGTEWSYTFDLFEVFDYLMKWFPDDEGLLEFNKAGVAKFGQVMSAVPTGKYAIPVTAVKDEEPVAETQIELSVVDFLYALKSGWNAVALPLIPTASSMNVQGMLDASGAEFGLGKDIDSIVRWNAGNQRWEQYAGENGTAGWYDGAVLAAPDATVPALETLFVHAKGEGKSLGLIFAPAARNLAYGYFGIAADILGGESQ